MFDLKVINSVLGEMEDERGIPRARMIDAIEQALATAYKKEFGKRGQIVRAHFDIATGTTTFEQVKIVVDETMIRDEDEEGEDEALADEDTLLIGDRKVRFDPEKHIMIENARLIKKDVAVGDELIFPLEAKDDFGRIAAQTAKQVIIQKIREAERDSALAEFGQKAGDVVVGHVQRFERGNLYVDLGRVTGVMPYEEQIPGERFRPGERIRALLATVDEGARGIFLKLSRASGDFLEALFAIEAPELQSGAVEVKAIAREAGSRSKIAVASNDPHLDPVGSLVGQRGVRVATVMSELGGEKIDVIEWSGEPAEFIEEALSPAHVLSVRIETEPDAETGERGHAVVEVAPDQQSLAIGRGGQNVRLAAKLTGWKIDIMSAQTGDQLAEGDADTTTDRADAVEATPAVEAVPPKADPVESPDRDMTPEQAQEEEGIETPDQAEAAIDAGRAEAVTDDEGPAADAADMIDEKGA
jgi:N utilization substance protein A